MKLSNIILASFISLSFCEVQGVEPPTMGWSSWNTYRVNISASIIEKQALAMKEKGLGSVGYKYVNIDDGFFGGRDQDGNLLINSHRFPQGLKPVVDYIHNLGFKAGIYSDGGKNTCGSYWDHDAIGKGSGLYGHDQKDCDFFFKKLGFDFIKIDFCGGDPAQNEDHLDLNEEERYTAIRKAIDNTGRKDVRINICRWAFPGTWVNSVGNSWRIARDITPDWGSIKRIINRNKCLSAYAENGAYNDMDMLEIGRGLTPAEERTHFGMWCIMSSPLLIGCDMTTMPARSLELIKNKDLIALNQDSLGLQAYPVATQNGVTLFVKDIVKRNGKQRAIAIYNPTNQNQTFTLNMKDIDLEGTVQPKDLFTHRVLPIVTNGVMVILVPAHDTKIYSLLAEKRAERTVYEAECAWLQRYQNIGMNNNLGYSKYEEKRGASGHMYASWLGHNPANWLEWKNVYSREGGVYKFVITYFSGEQRPFYCSINGGKPIALRENKLDWGRPYDLEFTANLKKGTNTIRLYNDTEWMPNIDKLTLKKIAPITSLSAVLKDAAGKKKVFKVKSDGRLNFKSDKLTEAVLYDVEGRIVEKLSLHKGHNKINLEKGIYYLLEQ